MQIHLACVETLSPKRAENTKENVRDNQINGNDFR